jgi:hypothetical protein
VRLRAILAELKPRVVWLVGRQQAEHSRRVVTDASVPFVVSRHASYASHAEIRAAWHEALEIRGTPSCPGALSDKCYDTCQACLRRPR